MHMFVAYKGRSGVRRLPSGLAVSLAPNLRRDRVSFVGNLAQPLRFREAVSALHDVVISDLKYKPKDRSAYEEFLAEQKKKEQTLRRLAYQEALNDLRQDHELLVPPGLEDSYRVLCKKYWAARWKYSNHLLQHDPNLWRYLTPCDPVVTVSPDVLFFECFSKDESSYGCLTVDRGAFSSESDVSLGTTNVDYSWALYEEFQRLRTYRQTQFTVDPAGFEVKTEGAEDYREEKIDLPPSWLRGFMMLQSAMSFPMRKVAISREALYNILAFLKRNKAKKSPRAVRFELEPGKPIAIVLEPWEKRIVVHDVPYGGAEAETIRTWGRDRLRVLARLLPLAEGADVYLLGTGLPSFWSVRMGEMRLLLGLSGWTTNDWTGGSALDALAPPEQPDDGLLKRIGSAFLDSPSQTFQQIQQQTGDEPALVAAGLNRFALMGQLIHDLPGGVYRWRQIMPPEVALGQVELESPETRGANEIVRHQSIKITQNELNEKGLRLLAGNVGGREVEAVLDGDGKLLGGKCDCSHHFKFKLRAGPCRHLQALRRVSQGGVAASSLQKWFSGFFAN